ncbi:peptidoglycan DD-metalloendopeptidase family protein [Clostridium scatologenes]|uniref:Peptidase, M23 family n=1 Tax=Clostridium scatologenes TaxID=1548 RepID=A0A0E3K323_CLOSL|nr:peptidoglycan DD-metalloendopeptidase family protein [Clostridium scatologenes]AKA71289.1 peptidase, M23 family [Clostridium scatologenes]
MPKKGMITLHSNNRSKIYLSLLIIIITSAVVIRYLYNNNPNCYEIYINGKIVGYVKDKEEFYSMENIIKKDVEKRFGKVNFKDDIKFVKKHFDDVNRIENSDHIKKLILENSNTKVNAVLMKSDGKEVSVLANEAEIRNTLDEIKNSYKEEKDDLKLVNHITYIKESVEIGKVNTVEQTIKNIDANSKNPIIKFSKNIEQNSLGNNLTLSRGSTNKVSFMGVPSQGTITSPFGSRWGTVHQGIDIGASMGAPICAAMDGKVFCTEWEDGYGNVIKIDHGNGMQTIYAHCSKICSNIGEYVKRGEKIGEVGSTGRSTGPHVHFEVRVNGKPENPLNYLQ